jgi:hypothetical protein
VVKWRRMPMRACSGASAMDGTFPGSRRCSGRWGEASGEDGYLAPLDRNLCPPVVTTRSCGRFASRRPRATRCRKNYSTVTTGVSTDPGSFFPEIPCEAAARFPGKGRRAPTGVVQPTTDVNRLPPIRSSHAAAPCTVPQPRESALWTARGTSCELEVDFPASNPQVWGRRRPTGARLRPRCRSAPACRPARRRSRAPGSR